MRAEEEMDGGEEALEQLRIIFNLCDSDRDGVISVDDFRRIGSEHFDKTQPMEVLIQQIDPHRTGHITFSMFRAGIETFLSRPTRSRSTSQSSACTDGPSSPPQLSPLSEDRFPDDTVHPLSSSIPSLLANGYTSDSAPDHPEFLASHSLSGDGEADLTNGPLTHSSPLSHRRQPQTATAIIRDGPPLLTHVRLQRHSQLAIPPSPGSQTSTPAEVEADEMVSQLSDQLLDLSAKLEHLEEDQRSSHGLRARLKREREELQARLEEYEDQVHATEQSAQKLLRETQDRHHANLTRLRRQSQVQMDELNTELLASKEEIHRLELTESSLRTQLVAVEERLEELGERVAGLEEGSRIMEEELSRTRELLRVERGKWEREKEVYTQTVVERDQQISQLQRTCDEVRREKKRRSITASDMDNEVSKLTKEVERLRRDNDQLQARFLQKGQELISQNVQSLADEMEDASKDDVMKALRETEQHNARLHEYIEGLLVTIIEKHPELLERR